MHLNDEILENKMIEAIAGSFPKPPHKINDIHESDAELIDPGDEYDKYLAITTDALAEEVSSGLYDDPYLLGWMLATVNFSDLAAVGAEPLGLMISISYPANTDRSFITALSKGISDACTKSNTFILGGDTNEGKELSLCGCAIGFVPKSTTVTRIGASIGDRLYLTAPAGLGNIFAFLQLSNHNSNQPGIDYQPVARLKEGRIIARFASCCMDTSDGVIHTLDTLMRLNRCQFRLNDNWGRILHPTTLQACNALKLPFWLALAGVHGEFELCFTINPDKETEFFQEATRNGWQPILIGEVAEGTGVCIETKKRVIQIDSTSVRNLSYQAGVNPESYINGLLDIAQKAGI